MLAGLNMSIYYQKCRGKGYIIQLVGVEGANKLLYDIVRRVGESID
jgi:hypothetical protein